MTGGQAEQTGFRMTSTAPELLTLFRSDNVLLSVDRPGLIAVFLGGCGLLRLQRLNFLLQASDFRFANRFGFALGVGGLSLCGCGFALGVGGLALSRRIISKH